MKTISFLLLSSILCTNAMAQTIRFVQQGGTGDGSSWALASPDLKAMINASAPNDQVWVAAGTYRPTTGTNTAIFFSMKDNVAIYGGFSGTETLLSQRNWLVNETILSGDIGVPNNNSDNSLHVIFNTILNSTAILDGFTIRDGHAKNTSPDAGAGMYNYRASVTIRNCRFTANIAQLDGGAIFNYDCSPIITDCIFDGNSTVNGNGGGAIFNDASHPLITNCVFAGNYANPSGGAIFNIGHPVITNCVFIGNEAAVKGGAIYNLSSSANGTFINSSFAGNTAPTGGAIMNYGAANVTIKNCILWGNSTQIFNDLGSIPTVTYSLVQGGYSGTGNINEDPLFVSQPPIGIGTTGDLHLLSCSSAIDLGTNSGAPSTDHDGNMRPFNATGTGTATTDIGAFEYQSTFTVFPWYVDADADDYASYFVNRCTPPVNAYALADISGTGTDDCNDSDNTIYPGAPELCDSKDNDCNPGTNENPGCCPTEGTIFYVNPNATGAANGHSWQDAFTNLQYALVSTCPDITQIWVAAGTYKPTTGTDRNISFVMKNNIAIYGGFAGTETSLSQRDWNANYTVLSGDIGEQEIHSDNSFHVVSNTGLNSTAILDGFTITHGYSVDYNSRGAGMRNVGSSPAISNCTFLSNGTSNTGIGGGMSNQANSSPTLTRCIFIGNLAEYGGGIFNDEGCSPTVNACLFSGNSATSGGGMYNYPGTSIVTNCLFTAHSGVSGSAVYNFGGSPQFINCTYTGNNSAYAGTIFNESIATPIFKNCIIWGNNSAITDAGWSASTVTYSIIQGGFAGTGNLNTDPLMAGSALGLLECSPAIDAGTNTGAPLTDIIGNMRPFNATGNVAAMTDIGAFEYSELVSLVTCYADTDDDGFGDPNASQAFCISCGEGYIIDNTDCNDMSSSDHPEGTEICDGVDNDCDGMIDEGSGNDPNVLFVKADANGLNDGTSWEHAYTSLQSALANDCPAFTQIWVAAGTYKPTSGLERTISFAMKNNMAIYGGFNGTESALNQRNWYANVTILSGNIGQTTTIWDNSHHVVANSGLNPTAILDGFTIIDGTADGSSTNSKGGGMYNVQSSPTIVNCVFTFNVAYGSVSGGGMFNENNSSPIMSYCTFIENSGPFGGGMYNASGCNPQLNGCVFNSNYGNYGGGILNFFASPVLTNCLFIGHTAIYQAAAVLNFGGSAQFINCTFTGNAGVVDGAVHNDAGATPVFQNCIVWGNSAGISNVVPSDATITYSIIQGGYAGTGNLDMDPLFNGWGDFSLQPCSPAIDAGSNTGAPVSDLVGNLRPFNTTGTVSAMTDMGAYEYSSVVSFVTCYADTDGDGYGDPDMSQVFCQSCDTGYVGNNTDCDDGNPSQNPDETEICDGVDNDCDGLIDEDNTPPTVLCQDVTISLAPDGTSSLTVVQINQGSYDNCDIASLSVSPNAFDCSDVGMHTVILTVTDVNGNSATGSANVTVRDITPPEALCQDVTVYLDANGQAGFTSSEVVFYNYSCDREEGPFSNVSQTFVATNSGFITRIYAGIGTWASPTIYSTTISTVSNTVNYGALLYSGRCCYSTCAPGNNMAFADLPNAFHVNAGETVTISFSGSGGSRHYEDGQLRLYVTGISDALAALDGGSSDVCGIDGLSASVSAFSCSDLGENIVTMTFTDAHGNSSTCSSTVTVVDNIFPIALSQDVTVYLDEDGNAAVSGAQVDDGSYDNCDIETLSVSPNAFTCADVGMNMVTLTVTDMSGHSDTHSAVVTVLVPPGVHQWLGGVSTHWDNPQNWSRCSVPTDNDDVMIEGRLTHPVIGPLTNAFAKSVTLKDNMILTIQGTLTVVDE